jgi:hypothetical protein
VAAKVGDVSPGSWNVPAELSRDAPREFAHVTSVIVEPLYR